MADNDDERREMSRIHGEIWEAAIAPGFARSNDLIDATKVEPPECLLHFTSASAVASILQQRKLRVSRARSSNDPKELDHGLSIAWDEQGKVTKDEADEIFRDELRASFQGRMTDGTERHLLDPHICCFTETGSADLVAQWAMYGRDGSGFALKFKGKALDKKADVGVVRINYGEQDQRAHVRDLLALGKETSRQAAAYADEHHGGSWGERSFRIAAHAFGGVVSLHAATMKAPEFSAEKEWRLVHPGMVENSRANVEAKGPILRSYFDVTFEPDDLLSIIVGPVHAALNRPVIWRLLREHGYTATTIDTGKVALRTLQGDRC